MGPIKIRTADSSDLDILMELRLSLQRHTENSNSLIWRITEEGKESLRGELEEITTDGNSRILVAEIEGAGIVGFIAGRVVRNEKYRPERVGEISLLYVKRKHRRQSGEKSRREIAYVF